LRNRYCDSYKRVKGNRLAITIWTSDFWSILTGHQVNNYWLISLCMSDPALQSNHFIRSSITVNRLNSRFFLNSVQILMKSIHKERKKLLRIMLCISRKHWIYRTNCIFYIVWRKSGIRVAPHWFDKLSVCLSKLSFSTDRIHNVNLLLEESTYEIFG
jgi:hypothetical protein